MGVVMVYSGRKVVVGYADIRSGCSVGHYGLVKEALPFWEELLWVVRPAWASSLG